MLLTAACTVLSSLFMPRHRGRARGGPRLGGAVAGWLAVVLAAVLALPARAQPLNIGVEPSLAAAMAAVAPAYTAARPGVRIALQTAPAAALLDEQARSAPFDVLVGLEQETAVLGQQRRLLRPEARAAFAGNRLVLVVPASGGEAVQRLADLAKPEVQRVALGRNGSLPLGRHGREALNAQRLWPSVQRKVVLADDGPALVKLVRDGAADAAFVYETDALAAGAELRVVQVLPTPEPLRHGAYLTSAGRQAEAAAAFTAWLRSDAARALLQARGFGPP